MKDNIKYSLEYIRNSPENIINLPEWMLTKEILLKLKEKKNIAIVEIAGRDSIAAALKYCRESETDAVIATVAYTGTEYGNWKYVENAVSVLRKNLRMQAELISPIFLGSPAFWKTLNGRFQYEIYSRFGFISPCIGCHLYLHTIRIPLAKITGAAVIVSGDRENHDGKIKINQTTETIDYYEQITKIFDIKLKFPLRNIDKGTEIERILHKDWKENSLQLDCVLSGNYLGIDGYAAAIRNHNQITNFFEKFALPLTKKVIDSYLNGIVPDHLAIGLDIIKNFNDD